MSSLLLVGTPSRRSGHSSSRAKRGICHVAGNGSLASPVLTALPSQQPVLRTDHHGPHGFRFHPAPRAHHLDAAPVPRHPPAHDLLLLHPPARGSAHCHEPPHTTRHPPLRHPCP